MRMDWVWYLFKFDGRINRAKYWLAVLIIGCWMILLMLLLFVPVGHLFGWPEELNFSLENIFAIVDPKSFQELSRADISAIVVNAITMPLFLWVFLATSVKRLHDRDMSGWWIIPFFAVPGLYHQFVDRLPHGHLIVFVTWPIAACHVWGVVELYFRPGTSWTNRFGPNPLDEDEDARLRSRRLGSRGAAWDQRYEIELTPHRASPMSSMHVNRGA
jgi:uncharacterized membrane protein YhaH (DUF805 family)